MKTEYISTLSFFAMIGEYNKSNRKNDRFYPQCTGLGGDEQWNKSQCEDFAEIYRLHALSKINHDLIGVSAGMSRMMKRTSQSFHFYAEFLGILPEIVHSPDRLKRAVALEYESIRVTKNAVLTQIPSVRERVKALKELAGTFPKDWGKSAYLEAIGQLVFELDTLQRHVKGLGRPVLNNAYSNSPKTAYKSYHDTWEVLSPQEKRQLLNSHIKDSKDYQRLSEHYTELQGEHSANAELLNQLNREIRQARKDTHVAYNARVSCGDYFLRSRPPCVTGNYFSEARTDGVGNVLIVIPAQLADQIGLFPPVRVTLGASAEMIILKKVSNAQ